MKIMIKSIKRQLIGFLVFSIAGFSTAGEKVVTHVVAEDETPWFLASVYYGKGGDYTKILAANKFQRPEEMKEGMKILIENPHYDPSGKKFAERYADLWKKRQKALGLTSEGKGGLSKVDLPTEKIRHRDQTPQLPFSEKTEAAPAPAEGVSK